jgi:hypothetical protein
MASIISYLNGNNSTIEIYLIKVNLNNLNDLNKLNFFNG